MKMQSTKDNETRRLLPSKDVISKPNQKAFNVEDDRRQSPVASGGNGSTFSRMKEWAKSPSVVFRVVALLLVVFALTFAIRKYLRQTGCLPAPYIYLTTHNSDNIMKFSRDGCQLLSRVVWYGSKQPKELRGLAAGTFMGHPVLFAADSADEVTGPLEESEIIVLGPCEGWFHMRSYLTATNAGHFGSYHAYSVAIDKDDNVFASFQHTDGVVRFAKDTLLPMPFPQSMYQGKQKKHGDIATGGNHYINNFKLKHLPQVPNGTFVQFGKPGLHNITEQGIRSIVFVPTNTTTDPNTGNTVVVAENLWIANEDHNRVFIVDSEANEVAWVYMHSPVGMVYDKTRNMVFVGSKSKKSVGGGGAVYGIDATTLSIVKTFTIIGSVGLMHPTGLLVYEDILYVAEQSANVIVAFNITSERFIRNVVTGLVDPVEQIILSSC